MVKVFNVLRGIALLVSIGLVIMLMLGCGGNDEAMPPTSRSTPVVDGVKACDTNMYRATATGDCQPIPTNPCDTDQYVNSIGNCVDICNTNQYRNSIGSCVDICAPNTYMTNNGECVDAGVEVECASDTELVDGVCESTVICVEDSACDDGSYRKLNGDCGELPVCDIGNILSYDGDTDSYSCEESPPTSRCAIGEYVNGDHECVEIITCGKILPGSTWITHSTYITLVDNKLVCRLPAEDFESYCKKSGIPMERDDGYTVCSREEWYHDGTCAELTDDGEGIAVQCPEVVNFKW